MSEQGGDGAVGVLREAAEAATSGPWKTASTDGMGVAIHRGEHDTIALYADRDNARFIAAADPTVVLALLDRLDALTDLASRAADALDKWNWVHENPSLVIDSVSRGLRRASLNQPHTAPAPTSPGASA